MVIFSVTLRDSAHACITNKSLTAIHAIVSTPKSFNLFDSIPNPGQWSFVQVGVNAPGTPNNTTFFPLKISSVAKELGFPSTRK